MMSKKNIREHVLPHIREGLAHFDVQDQQAGVVFRDENEFIPFSDLGYNSEIGWFRISSFPGAENETSNDSGWTIHPTIDYDVPSGMYALLDSDGYGYLLGERYQVFEAWQRLGQFLFEGVEDEPIPDDAEELGHKWLSISEAAHEAVLYDPVAFGSVTRENLHDRIRRQAQRSPRTIGASHTPTGRWKFQARRFRGWLARTAERKGLEK